MPKPNTLEAWKLLLLSLPKGIASFAFAVAGLTVGIVTSAFVIGLPLLALVLIMSRRMLESENRLVSDWLSGAKRTQPEPTAATSAVGGKGWKSLFAVFGSARAYRGVFYCISQLGAGIAFFTLSVVLPVTSFAIMLSPAAYLVSDRLFDFDLFDNGWLLEQLFPSLQLSSYQQSWIAGGIGALLTLAMPMTLRTLGRFYAVWIQGIAGPEPTPKPAQAAYAMPRAEADVAELSLDDRLESDAYRVWNH